MSTSGVDTVTAAARRRQRRLRAYLWYARMSVAMAWQRARTIPQGVRGVPGPGRRGARSTTRYDDRGPLSPQPELFQLYEDEPGGSRPACLVAPRGPQEKVQQCTVEQLADVVPMVQILDTPGLLGGDQVVEVLRLLDVPAIEQAIAVPKISLDRVPQRSAARCPQTAEQLVDVPTEPVYVAMVLASKVYSRREIRRILSGHGSTASGLGSSEHIGDVPVPQVRWGGGWRRSSRFSCRAEFNSSGRGADR